ncbi:MAG: CinA family protein [Proteobacteria bacterium]|nr:CinA family protein [Pseudomonadota bacterium]
MESLTELTRTLGATLLQRKQTVAVAESSAAGLISAALLAVPGASAFYRGGVVSYTVYARQAFLAITDADMVGLRASTEPYALLMARRVKEKLGTDWAVGETGATGPTGNRYGDAAGHACVAVIGPGFEKALTIETRHGARESNMWTFTRAALELFEQALAGRS